MELLHIKGTSFSPEVYFDGENNYFVLSGRSLDESADQQYYPIIRYLENYKNEIINKKNTNQKILINFSFNLVYYNTISIRYLNTIMKNLEDISSLDFVDLKIYWHYDTIDEYMEELCDYFNDYFDIRIIKIPYVAPIKKRKFPTNEINDIN